MGRSLWAIRIFFLLLCTLAGFAVSELRPDVVAHPFGPIVGFGLGGLLVAIDEMLKGFSLRAFSAATFGLFLGTTIAWMLDQSQLFRAAGEDTRWLIRLGSFLGCGYIGMVLAMRSNKEDFSLIIPYVRFKSQSKPEKLMVLDTSVIIDGRIADLIESRFLEGTVVVPRFVLKELQHIADSSDAVRRARGRRGLEMLNRIQRNPHSEVKIHEAEFPEEKETDAKLLGLTRSLGAKLFTNDYNLGEIAELQSVPHVNLHKLALALKPALLPGDVLVVTIKREGKEKGQGVGYLNDGTMVVVNQAQPWIGQQVQAEVQSLLQTGMGVIVFADLKEAAVA
jgi:uncharacterized protein YacL